MSLSKKKRGRLQELAREAQQILSESQQPSDRPMTFAELEEASIEAGDCMTACCGQVEPGNTAWRLQGVKCSSPRARRPSRSYSAVTSRTTHTRC
jgi:hypothetical protein